MGGGEGIWGGRPNGLGLRTARLAGAVLAGQNGEWTESRRYMGLEILAVCQKAAQPDMGKNSTSETGLAGSRY
jgi:hypothetical protein